MQRQRGRVVDGGTRREFLHCHALRNGESGAALETRQYRHGSHPLLLTPHTS